MRTQPRHRARPTGARQPVLRRPVALISAFWLAAVGVLAVSATPALAAAPFANDDTATTVANTAAYINVLNNDGDPDFDSITVSGATQPAHGTVSCTLGGICVYDPATGYVGTDAFRYTVTDGSDSAVADVSITVTAAVPGNRAPTAVDDEATAGSGAWAFLSVLDNDTDPDGDSLQVNTAGAPAHGTVECSSAVYCVYTSDIGYAGPDSFSYVVADGRGGTDNGRVEIDVTPNHAPVADDDDLVTREGAPARSVDVTANDTDADGDPLSASRLAGPAHGTATCDSARCQYTPAAGYVGPDFFTYTVSDGRGGTDVATVRVDVRANTPPAPSDDELSAVRGVTLDFTLLDNDVDADGDRLRLVDTTDPSHGEVNCDQNGFCDYTSDDDFVGTDAFTYEVSDGAASATADVEITVTEPCPPARCIDNGTIALAVHPEGHLNVPDGTGSVAGPGNVGLMFLPTGNEATAPGCLCEGWGVADAATGITGFVSEDTDHGANNLSVESFDATASTARSVVDVGDDLRVTHDFHPTPRTPNLYEIDVTIENLTGQPMSDLRYRRVTDWDVEPTQFSEYVTIQGGDADALLFDSDHGFATANPLGERPSILATGDFVDSGPVDHGALLDFGFGSLGAGATRTFTIYYGAAGTEAGAERALDAVGAEVYSLAQPDTADGATLGTPNTFVVAFSGVGGSPAFSPQASDDELSVQQDGSGSVDVLANDTDPNGDELTVTTAEPPADHGDVTCTVAGTCTYTPDAGYSGPDSFEYSISDGNGGADSATVDVDVVPGEPQNADPVAIDDELTTDAGTAGSVDVLSNDTDPDGDPLTVTTSGPAAEHGTVACTDEGTCTYTPAAGFSGSDTFEYAISDGNGGADTAEVSVDVVAAPGQLDLELSDEQVTTQYSDVLGPVSATASGGEATDTVLSTTGLPAAVTLTDHGDGTGTIGGVVVIGRGSYAASVQAVNGDETVTRSLGIDITPEDAKLGYLGQHRAVVPADADTASARLAADVDQAADGSPGDVTRARVYFDVYAGAATPAAEPDRTVGPVAAGDDGVAQTTVDLPAGTWTVVARFDAANAYFAGPAADPAELTVAAEPVGEGHRAYGSGGVVAANDRGHHHHWWRHHPWHHHGHRSEVDSVGRFWLDWTQSADGAVDGSAHYVFRGPDGNRYVLRSATIGRLTFADGPQGMTSTAKGFGTLCASGGKHRGGHHHKSGETLGRVWFRIDVTDGGAAGVDRFAISVRKDGDLFHQVGRPGEPRPIVFGDLVVS